MNRLVLALVLVCGLPAPLAVRADSIWDRRSYSSCSLFVDSRARRVGDLVTVAIAELTGIENKDERDAQKNTNAGGTFALTGNITGTSQTANRQTAANLNAQATSTRQFTGKSQYNVNQSFTDQMTATVVEVLSNGNLVIEGYRSRVVGKEVRTLKISGVIRPVDIGVGNVIQSSFIADFRIQYLGKGDQSGFSNQGWLGQALNHLWPW